jgi:hypothetical protein
MLLQQHEKNETMLHWHHHGPIIVLSVTRVHANQELFRFCRLAGGYPDISGQNGTPKQEKGKGELDLEASNVEAAIPPVEQFGRQVAVSGGSNPTRTTSGAIDQSPAVMRWRWSCGWCA